MLYALAIVLIFALNMLIASKFRTLGMIPGYYISAGVSLSFLLHQVITRISLSKFFRGRFVLAAFLAWVFSFFLYNLVLGFGWIVLNLVINIQSWFKIQKVVELFMFLYSIALFIWFLIDRMSSISLKRWLLYVSATGAVRFGIVGIPKELSVFMHCWGGIFDLVVQFGLLMVLFVVIKQEHCVE